MFCLFLLELMLVGCTAPTVTSEISADPEIIKSLSRYKKEYLLQAGDKIEVFVYHHQDFSKTGTIRPDGYLTLPVLDDIKAAGLSPKQLDKTVTTLLSKRIKDPEVTVFIENIIEPMIYIHGEVGNAAAIPLRKAKTIAQALSHVGGLEKFAALDSIAVIRLQDDGYLRALSLENIGSGQSAYILAMQNTPLLAEDIIFVPENSRSQFTRFVQDFINTPLQGLNSVMLPYFQFKLIQEFEKDN